LALRVLRKKLHIASASQPYIQVQSTGGVTGSAYYGYNSSTGSASIESTGSIRFAIPGNEAARIDSSGRLLVGTSTDQGNSILQVQGEAGAATAAGVLYLRRGLNTAAIGANVGADLGKIQWGANDGTIGAWIQCLSDATWSSTSDTPSALVFSTTADGASSPTERLRITSAGLVGIGTSSPNSVLQVNSGTNLGGVLIGFNAGSSNFYDADLQVFRSGNGTERVRIDSSGRVGIGTTSPGSIFDVKPSASSSTLSIEAGTINSDSVRLSAGGTVNTYLEYRGYLGHAWFVNTTERARIDSSGRLLVGTTSASGSTTNTAPVIAGFFQSFNDGATFTTGVAQTLFTAPNTSATYIITLRRGAVGDAANFEAVSILSVNALAGGPPSVALTDLKTAGTVSISLSGADVQGTQTTGGSASLSWVVTRVG
jgi:hypothetical protein